MLLLFTLASPLTALAEQPFAVSSDAPAPRSCHGGGGGDGGGGRGAGYPDNALVLPRCHDGVAGSVGLIINGQTVVEGGPVIIIPADRSRAIESGDDQNTPRATTRAAAVQILYTLKGNQGHELFLIADAPAVNIRWSYLNAAGQWIALPANLATISPFVLSAQEDGSYPLFNGVLPAGLYELYLVVDYVKNGYLDIGAGNHNLNGFSIHARFQVL
jgi:hypothetical protein